MLRLFIPHLRIQRVEQLTVDRLRELGLDSLLLDVDCTLTRYRARDVGPEVAAWFEELQRDAIGLCLVSNGMGKRIGGLAAALGVPFVAGAFKPFPCRLHSAMRKMGFQPRRTAMVGDQLFADVIAGRLAGLTSILVDPIHPEDEPWFTRIKRGPERHLLRRMDPPL